MFETSSEEEAGGTDSVIDVEDLGNIMGHMKKAKVLLLEGVWNGQVLVTEQLDLLKYNWLDLNL